MQETADIRRFIHACFSGDPLLIGAQGRKGRREVCCAHEGRPPRCQVWLTCFIHLGLKDDPRCNPRLGFTDSSLLSPFSAER